jgi:hypothetical protein
MEALAAGPLYRWRRLNVATCPHIGVGRRRQDEPVGTRHGDGSPLSVRLGRDMVGLKLTRATVPSGRANSLKQKYFIFQTAASL